MKLGAEPPRRNRRVLAGEVLGVPEKDELGFDPSEVNPRIIADMESEIQELVDAPGEKPYRAPEAFFLLEAYQYLKPEGMPSLLGRLEGNLRHIAIPWLKVGDNPAGSKMHNPKLEEVKTLFISLCRLFPHKTPEFRAAFDYRHSMKVTDDTFNPNLFTFGPIFLQAPMALVLLKPDQWNKFVESLEAHLPDVNERLATLRDSLEERMSEFAELVGDILLLAPQLKSQIDIRPIDIQRMKGYLKFGSVTTYEATRIIKCLVYYQATQLGMSSEGRVELGTPIASVREATPLPPREIV